MQPLILPPQSQPLALPNNRLDITYYLFLQAIRDAIARGAEMVQFGSAASRKAFNTVGLPNAALWFEDDTGLLYQWRVYPGVSMGWVAIPLGTTVYFGQDSAVVPTPSNTITLGSTPLPGSVVLYVNGDAIDSYTLSGNVLTLSPWVLTGDVVRVTWATLTNPPGGITLTAVGLPHPVLRGTAIQAGAASSYVATFPLGTRAGDLAIVQVGHAYNINTPTGWTVNDGRNGSTWNGCIFSKILTSADITTGSVTVTTSGSFDGVVAIATWQGATAGIREVDVANSVSGHLTVSMSTSAGVVASDTLLYFGSVRAASTVTSNRGTFLQTANDGFNGSGCLYFEDMTTSGSETVILSYSPLGEYYQSIVVVRGL